MNEEKLIELKESMIRMDSVNKEISENRIKFEEEHKDFFANQEKLKSLISEEQNIIMECKDILRENAETGFLKDGIKKRLGGVGIRVMKELIYNSDTAFKWAKEKDLFLKLDTRAFETVAKTGEIDFVEIKEKTTVTFPKQIAIDELE